MVTKEKLICVTTFLKNDKKHIYLKENLKNVEYLELISFEEEKYLNSNLNSIKIMYCHPSNFELVPKLIEKFTNLEWIQCAFAGVEKFAPCKELILKRNIVFTNMKGVFSDILSEFIFAGIMYFEKKLNEFHEQNKNKQWVDNQMITLKDKTIGIVGYGNIGAKIAKKAKLGFEMKVLGYKSNLKYVEGREYLDDIMSNDEIYKLLETSDYIINILPKTEKTNNFFDIKKFEKMKNSSIFINIGRGNSVDEDVLISFLKNKRIKAAVLDVTKIEPLPKESQLWNLDNCLITNHSGDTVDDGFSNSLGALNFFIKIVKEEYINTGKVSTNLVDLEKGY